MLWTFRLVKILFFAFLMKLVQLMIFLFFYSIFTAVISSHDKMTIIIMIILIINITKSIQVHNKAVG